MSLRYEQHESLRRTKEFLFDLLLTDKRPKTVKELKSRVRRCLRHFPPLTKDGEPMFSNDPWSDKG
jgi:hypothetical protein